MASYSPKVINNFHSNKPSISFILIFLLWIVESSSATVQKEEILKILSATCATSLEQSSKCGLGKSDKIIVIYDHIIVVQFNALPIIISLLANVKSNIGLLIQLEHDIMSTVEPLRQIVQSIERENAQV